LETNQLIRRLAEDAAPIRRLPAPWRRAAIWFAISLPYVAAVIYAHAALVDPQQMLADRQFLVEEAATLLTAIAAVIAAFCSVVPGFSRMMLLLPLPPLLVWLASLGEGCLRDWLRLGAAGLQLRPDWDCLPPAAMLGIVPMIAIVVMLRRGAPLYPRVTLALAALATASLANFALRTFHVGDASIMVLVWHFGGVLVLSLLAGWIGKLVLSWKHLTTGPATADK